MENQNFAVGVDIGGTKIASILVDQAGQIVASDYRMTAVELGPQESINRVVASIASVIEGQSGITGIGIDVPGLVYPELGVVENAVNLNWDRVNLAEIIREKLHSSLPIFLQRDTFAQTLGEYYYGAARGEKNYVYLGIGSGLGAGALIDGRLLIGSNHAALEVGHLTMTGLMNLCGCGRVGCAETLLSGLGLHKTYVSPEWHPELPLQAKGDLSISAEYIIEQAQQAEPRALLLINEFGKYLGELLSDLVMTLNPALIVIGGGVGLSAYDLFIDSALAEIERRCFPNNIGSLQIKKSSLNSSALGAASLVWYSMKENRQIKLEEVPTNF